MIWEFAGERSDQFFWCPFLLKAIVKFFWENATGIATRADNSTSTRIAGSARGYLLSNDQLALANEAASTIVKMPSTPIP